MSITALREPSYIGEDETSRLDLIFASAIIFSQPCNVLNGLKIYFLDIV